MRAIINKSYNIVRLEVSCFNVLTLAGIKFLEFLTFRRNCEVQVVNQLGLMNF